MDPIINLRNRKKKSDNQEKEVLVNKGENSREFNRSARIAWLVPENYHHYSKGKLILVGIVLAILSVTLIIIWEEYLFGIFIALSILIASIFIKKDIGVHNVIIDKSGIHINDDHYPYRNLRSFWITYEPGSIKELAIEIKSWYVPIIHAPIYDVSPMAIRDLLIKHLPEKHHDISLMNSIFRKIGL